MYLAKLSQVDINILKNFTETPENILNLIVLSSKVIIYLIIILILQGRVEFEKDYFRILNGDTINDQWDNLVDINPWYSHFDLIHIMVFIIVYVVNFISGTQIIMLNSSVHLEN